MPQVHCRGGNAGGKHDEQGTLNYLCIVGISCPARNRGMAYGASQASSSTTATAQLRTQLHALRQALAQEAAAQVRDTAAEKSARSAVTSAAIARLGVCWNASYGTATGDYGSYAESMSIDAPVTAGGVTTCPQGDTFVPVVPQATARPGP